MAVRLTPKTRARLLRLLHGETAASAEEHELNAVFLQVALAIMLIFMITFFLFVEKTGGEISRLDELKSQVEEARRDKLANALEHVASYYRTRYGLVFFLRVDPETGARSFDLSGVIREGALGGEENPRRSFRLGGQNAWLDYSAPGKLAEAWENETLHDAGLTMAQLSDADRLWLKEQLKLRIGQIRGEVAEVQTLAAATLQEHFAAHPEAVADPELQKLLTRINSEKAPAARRILLAELAGRLNVFVRKELHRISAVPMLEELP